MSPPDPLRPWARALIVAALVSGVVAIAIATDRDVDDSVDRVATQPSDATTTSPAVEPEVHEPTGRGPLTLPGDLPAEGIALDVEGEGVRLVALDGTVVATLPGATFHRDPSFSDTPRSGPFEIWNATDRVRVGDVIADHERPETPSDHDDCLVGDERGDTTILLCGPATPFTEVDAQTIEVVRDGARSKISDPAFPPHPEIGAVGHWRSAQLSPSGRHVLALWSGECEVPDTFVVSLDGSDRFQFPGNGLPLGWSASGDALALLLHPGCGHADVPGVYAMTPGQPPRLVVALPARDRDGTSDGVVRWRR